MRYQQQLSEADCGPACIVMAASHYDAHFTIGRAREFCKTDSNGTNLAGMTRALQSLGFTANAMRGEVKNETLDLKIIFPFIAHVIIPQESGELFDHYVVVRNVNKKEVEAWDPDPLRGRQKIAREDFLKLWTGYALFLSPGADFKAPKKEKNSLLKFLPLLEPHKKTLAMASLSSALLIVLGLLIANYYRYVMDEVVSARAQFTLAAFSVGAFLVIFAQSVLEKIRASLINHFAFKVGARLNFSYIAHIFRLPMSFFGSRRTGDIMARLYDVATIRNALSGALLALLFDCVLILVVGPILFSINRMLFAIAFAGAALMGATIYFFAKLFKTYYGRLRRQEAEASSTLVEALRGAHAIKALNAEHTIGKLYEEKQMRAVWTGWQTAKLSVWQYFLAGLLNGLISVLIFWAGGRGMMGDEFSFGALLSFNALLAYFINPIFRIINIQPQIQEATIAAQRVSEILETDTERPEGVRQDSPESLWGDIELSNVFFKYGMRSPVYQDLSLKIEKGQWAAFVGPSGCGKSTLAKLLLKFYEPEKGSVSIAGRDLRGVDAAALRAKVGYVPQEVYVFAGTVAENIALGNPDASMDAVTEAARKAGAHGFISELPDQYETKLGEGGSTLSGGERQRLALARALLQEREILVLDEATASLDTASERGVHETLERMRGTVTAVLVAHRLSTIKNCDVIFVMDKGRIVESGNHEELLARGGLYKKLWEEAAA